MSDENCKFDRKYYGKKLSLDLKEVDGTLGYNDEHGEC